MPILRHFVLTIILAGCGMSGKPPVAAEESDGAEPRSDESASAEARYRYVGTYEHFATPFGSSVSVLMADGEKIKITSVDDTDYINITVNNGIPAMRISGTYGINGEFSQSSTASGELFVVRQIEHLGGGEDPQHSRNYPALPDFFLVDEDARGPLTLSELKIEFPDSLSRFFDDDDRECFFRQVEWRAADMGDPLTMAPVWRALIANGNESWEAMANADKRRQLARYVTSMALHAC